MSKYFLLIVLFVATFNLSSARQVQYSDFNSIELGQNPVYSFHWGTVTHFFCAGLDLNQNGVLDAQDGDEAPTWWTIGKSGNKFIPNQMKTFEFQSMSNDFKPEIDSAGNTIYLPFKNKIASYKLLTLELVNDEVYSGAVEAVKFAGSHLIIIDKGTINAETQDYDQSKLVVFSIQNSMVLQSIPIGTNATDLFLSKTDAGDNSVYILCNPTKASEQYTVQYLVMLTPDLTSFNLNNVKSFVANNGNVYVSCLENKDESDGTGFEAIKVFANGEMTSVFTGLKKAEASVLNSVNGELMMVTPNHDIRFVKNDGSVDFIAEINGLEDVNFRHISYWGNDYVVLVPEANNTNNLVYISAEKNVNDILKYVAVGKQPAKIEYSKKANAFHVFCLGYDANYNSTFDDGDEKPSWWVITKDGANSFKSEKVYEFEMGDLKFPLKLAYDEEIDLFYIPHQGKISSYDALEYTLVEESVYAANATSVDLAGPHLMFPVRNQDKDDELLVFDRANSNLLQTIPGGTNILESAYFTLSNGIGIAILNEGNYGAADATLQYGAIPHTQQPNLETVNIGMTGNDLTYKNGLIGTTSNGSHNINFVYLPDNSKTEMKTGTTGYNGPRNISLSIIGEGMSAYVSTYNNDIRKFNGDGLVGITKTIGKVEDIYVNENEFAATIISNDDYSPNNQVAFFGDWATSVENNVAQDLSIQVYPNPTSDYTYIRYENPINEINVYDLNGNLVFSAVNQNQVVKIDLLNFKSGVYIVNVKDNDSIKSAKLNVVK